MVRVRVCGGWGFLTCPGIEMLLLVGVAPSSLEEPICWMMPASSEAGSAPRTYTCGRRGRGGRRGVKQRWQSLTQQLHFGGDS